MLKRRGILLTVLAALGALAACTTTEPETVEVVVTREVVQTVQVPGESATVEVTREVVATQEVIVEVTAVPGEEMMDGDSVTMYGTSTTDIPTLDPQLGEDSVSINLIENLFVNLTNYDLETSEVVPEAATDWTISDDGLVYTFNIRNDIPWVYHTPGTSITEQVVDDEGNPRFVTAHDFVYAIKRACNPNTGSYYSSVVAPQILGCNEVLNADDPGDIPAELIDAIGVTAPDDATLIIELAFPAGYFLSMTPLWTLAASPSWTIAEFGGQWIEAGNIVTNGRYALDEWVHNVRRTIVRNPLMPADLQGSGNIERFEVQVVPDIDTAYALWLNSEIEQTAIPNAELQAHLDNYGDETDQIANLSVFYFGFRFDKAPFDDVHVRRAFAAGYDRELHIQTVRQGQGVPMKHLAPPGIFGAPPINEVGVGFDPDYARAQLAEAGYPNCEGLPTISLLGYSGQNTLDWIEFAQAQWEEHLGCSADTIQIEQLPFAELLDATLVEDPNEAPHIWTLAWGPDYADENNWVGDVLWCETSNRQRRECDEIDDMIVAARIESDPTKRVEMYAEIEEAFFGEEGTFPISPLFLNIGFQASHSWLERIPSLFGGNQIYNWTIDQAAQLEARGN